MPVNLDDMTFDALVDSAVISIEEWSDRNAHDPGIMLIELFAWLTEMQRFYINRAELSARPAVHAAAVCERDYEELVLQLDGVEKVKAYFTGKHSVTIAVSGETKDILGHLEPYRLIGTEIAVVSPHFVRLKVTAEVKGQPFRKDIRPLVEQAIRDFFTEQFGGFGAYISVEKVAEYLSSLEVIDEVLALELNTEGMGVKRDLRGNAELSPRSLLIWEGMELYVR